MNWHVYELNGDGVKNYIGSVQANDEVEAVACAHNEYGAPIKVEEGR